MKYKPLYLLLFIALNSNIVFSQNLAQSMGTINLRPTGPYLTSCDESRPEVRKSIALYSEWRKVSCYGKLEYRIMAFYLGKGSTNTKFDKNIWNIQFRSFYDDKIDFDYKLYVGGELMIEDDFSINNVSIDKFWGIDCAGGSSGNLSNNKSLSYRLEIENLKFRKSEDFMNCDGSRVASTYNSSSSNQTYSNTQQSQNTDPTTTLAQTALSILGNFTSSNSRDKIRAQRAERKAQENNNSSRESYRSSTRYETQSSSQYETPTNTYDYSTAVKYANVEANKDTYDGYRNAIKLLESYVYKLNGEDLNSLGYYYWKVKDYFPASKYYKMSGDKGNDWGNNNLALCYQNGWGVDKNNFQAFEYYSKVGSTFERIGETYHQIGHLCVAGANNTTGTADYATASSYYSMGANSNNSECMLHLGELYDIGGQLKTNLTLAKYWYKKACNLKNEKACTKLKALE